MSLVFSQKLEIYLFTIPSKVSLSLPPSPFYSPPSLLCLTLKQRAQLCEVKRNECSCFSEETGGLARSSNGTVLVGECAIMELGPLIALFPSGLNCPHIEHRRVSLGTLLAQAFFHVRPFGTQSIPVWKLSFSSAMLQCWSEPRFCFVCVCVCVSWSERKAKLAQNWF